MSAEISIPGYRQIISDYHAWRARSGFAVKLLLAALLAVLTGLSAQVSIPLPGHLCPLPSRPSP